MYLPWRSRIVPAVSDSQLKEKLSSWDLILYRGGSRWVRSADPRLPCGSGKYRNRCFCCFDHDSSNNDSVCLWKFSWRSKEKERRVSITKAFLAEQTANFVTLTNDLCNPKLISGHFQPVKSPIHYGNDSREGSERLWCTERPFWKVTG